MLPRNPNQRHCERLENPTFRIGRAKPIRDHIVDQVPDHLNSTQKANGPRHLSFDYHERCDPTATLHQVADVTSWARTREAYISWVSTLSHADVRDRAHLLYVQKDNPRMRMQLT
jgi:hypothetical protein